MGILLELSERQRFAAYCRYEATSYDGLAKQADKFGIEPIADINRRLAAAYTIVAQHLEAVEDITIGSADSENIG